MVLVLQRIRSRDSTTRVTVRSRDLSDQSMRSAEKDPRIEAALAEYFERIDCGEPVDRVEYLARHASIADQLISFIAAEEEIHKLAAGGTPSGSLEDSTKSFDAQGQDTNVTPGVEGIVPEGG